MVPFLFWKINIFLTFFVGKNSFFPVESLSCGAHVLITTPLMCMAFEVLTHERGMKVARISRIFNLIHLFSFLSILKLWIVFFFLIYLCLFNYLEDHNFLCELLKIFDLISGVFLSCQVHVNTHCVIKLISYQVCLPNFIFKIVLNFTFLSYSNMNIYLT